MVLLVKGPAAQDKWQSKHRIVIMESVPHILFQRLPDLLLLPPCAFHFADHVVRGRKCPEYLFFIFLFESRDHRDKRVPPSEAVRFLQLRIHGDDHMDVFLFQKTPYEIRKNPRCVYQCYVNPRHCLSPSLSFYALIYPVI